MIKNIFLTEAIRIGDQLLSLAERDEHGLSWKTMSLGQENTIQWNKSEGIYSGVSGIVLFLLELYRQADDAKYLDAATKGMQWIEWYCVHHPTNYYALFTGRMGVAYTFLQLAKVTGEKLYLHKALAIARDCSNFLEYPKELINGTSGTLLGLLHLHAVTKESWLLEIINQYVQSLIESAKFGKVGLYWDIDALQVHPLCGFSHGTSGIGFVFLELGHYFKNPSFYAIAEQAFAYENYYFNKRIKNWPDFRLNMYTEEKIKEYEKAYQEGNNTVFEHAGDMNAWCHGAPGIGLSRLRAYELMNDIRYQRDIRYAATKTRQTFTNHVFTICHGDGGNAEFFIEKYLLFHNEKDRKTAEQVAIRLLQQKKKLGKYFSGMRVARSETKEDMSLFNGIAGIGYFLLRVNNPEKTPSILAPKVSSQEMQKEVRNDNFSPWYFLTLTPSQLQQTFLKKIFPRTIEMIKQYSPQQLEKYLQEDTKNVPDKLLFIHFIKSLLKTFPTYQRQQLQDVFTLERLKIQMDEESPSNALLFMKDRVNLKRARKLLDLSPVAFLKYTLQITSECTLFATKGGDYFLLKRTATGVEERVVSQFCFAVLQAFTTPKTVKDVVTELIAFYSGQDVSQKKMIQEKVIEQAREALRYTILMCV